MDLGDRLFYLFDMFYSSFLRSKIQGKHNFVLYFYILKMRSEEHKFFDLFKLFLKDEATP